MKYFRNRFSVLLTIILLALGAVNAYSLKSADDKDAISLDSLKPLKTHVQTANEILKQLHYKHYREMDINNELSAAIYDHYIKNLDEQKSYFIAADIKEFDAWRYRLDDTLKAGDLSPGFDIFNRYQQRSIERLSYLIQTLEGGLEQLDLSKEEVMETDRSDQPWPKDNAELDHLWRLKLKNSILTLKLAGKSLPDIQQTLLKKYRNKLKRIEQNSSDDAFQIYMNALTQAYDPHTQYFSPRTSENFNINMSLSLEGIGAVLQSENEYTKVVRLVPAGPADKSKLLQPADRIVGVGQGHNGELVDVAGWRIDEVVDLIRGPKGSTVRLEIIPSTAKNEHDTRVIHIVRDQVRLEEQAAQSKIIEVPVQDKATTKVGIIDIPTFYVDFKGMQNRDPNYRSTTRDVKKLITQLKKEDIDGLIIDLRNNGGGSLQEANSLLGLFIRTGPTVQVKDDRGKVELLEDQDQDIAYSGPLIVLVNRLSASASEIFAGAIQDYQRGLIVGTRTFGKGTVQALKPLNQGQLKITQAKFYRISGGSNQHQGVIPDIELPSLYDPTEIGESALDNALPWDTIRPVKHDIYLEISPYLTSLRQAHQKRVLQNPDYQFLVEQLTLIKKLQDEKFIFLNESKRIERRKALEAERLALENAKRAAKGLPPLKSLPDEDPEDLADLNPLAEHPDSEQKNEDPLLQETAHILADFISVAPQRLAIY